MLDRLFDRFYLWLGRKVHAFVSQEATVSAYRKTRFERTQQLKVMTNELCPMGSESMTQNPYMDDLFDIIYHRQY